MTRAFRAYEPDDVPELEGDEFSADQPEHMNVLWGRVVVLAIALLLAFSFGRITVAAGPGEAEVERLRGQLAEAQQKASELESEIAARDALAAATAEQTDAAAAEDDAAQPADTAPVQPSTYTVKKGNTLRQIAQKVCGDTSLAGPIAQLNGIRDATALSVGQTLRLPANCA
jgi:nucleoid-associated protein YgaU